MALRINQYDVQNKLTYSVDLMDAFPVAISQMDLDWTSDGYHKITVSFEYTSWKNNSIEALAMQVLEDGISRGLASTRTTSTLGSNLRDDEIAKNMFNPDIEYR